MVRAHVINAADPGSILAEGPLLHVISPSHVSSLSAANTGVCHKKKKYFGD